MNLMNLKDKVMALMNTEVKEMIKERIKEFMRLKEMESREIFKELCFCILTANFSAEKGMRIQKRLGDDFLYADEETLAKKLKEMGHRYPKTRARYIVEARGFADSLKNIISSLDKEEKRSWLVKNIKGIGYKEASHFLRNTGYLDYAILDFHIIDLLEKNGLIKRPNSLTKRRYLKIESILKNIAATLKIPVGELDLYLWYMETGKVLK